MDEGIIIGEIPMSQHVLNAKLMLGTLPTIEFLGHGHTVELVGCNCIYDVFFFRFNGNERFPQCMQITINRN